jgi:hypothetical protein
VSEWAHSLLNDDAADFDDDDELSP